MLRKTLTRLLLVLAIITLNAAAVAAQGTTLKLMYKPGLGSYLTGDEGMTLYYFTNDTPGKTVCTDDCLVKWPALKVDRLIIGPGLEARDFGELDTADGKRVTFRGYPLYYSSKDAKPGDTNGQGAAGRWYVIDPMHFTPLHFGPY
jgi:predicted lipoprotein with Yx(FWY)xxD motif